MSHYPWTSLGIARCAVWRKSDDLAAYQFVGANGALGAPRSSTLTLGDGMNVIYHPDLAPLILPEHWPAFASDVVRARYDTQRTLVQEVFRRTDGTYGFRYQAWVNFADAGGGPHHLWQEYFPPANAFADSEARARSLAEAHATDCGATFTAWTSAQPSYEPNGAPPRRLS